MATRRLDVRARYAVVLMSALVLAAGCGDGGGNDQADVPDTTEPDTTDASDAPCPQGQTLCGDVCVETLTDVDHCGGCDTACPEADECVERACVEGACAPVAEGTALAEQAAGDCQLAVCDGAGGTTTQPDTEDVPDDRDVCSVGTCRPDGTPEHVPAEAGTACMVVDDIPGLCDGQPQPSCVQCLTHDDCSTPAPPWCHPVTHTCVDDVVLVVAVPGGTGAASIGGSFDGTTWTTATLGSGIFVRGGGGVVVTNDLDGLAVLRAGSGSTAMTSAPWSDGSWQQLAPTGVAVNSAMSNLTAGLSGAFVVHPGPPSFDYQLAEYDAATDSWVVLDEATGVGAEHTAPVVVLADGEPMLIATHDANDGFRSVRREMGTWQAPQPIPGATTSGVFSQETDAVALAGSANVLAVVRDDSTAWWSVWSDGAWSQAEILTSDADFNRGNVVDLAALPGGRVAAAYVDRGYALQVAFYDGTSWSSFRSVPDVDARAMALARGSHNAAVLELVVSGQSSGHLTHMRLTDEASWTWASPLLIDGRSYETVDLAVGPR